MRVLGEGFAIEHLSLLLFERMGMLLVFTFILTRIPLFRQLLDRKMNLPNIIYFSGLFGLFGILGTYAGVIVQGDTLSSGFWILPLEQDQAIAHLALVGIVIGGLMGGPIVGVGAGLLTGVHLLYIGGYTGVAGVITSPLTGLLAGGIARFFSQERVISPGKVLFIGMFAPIIHMGIILICVVPPDKAIQLVDSIGIPMVLTNSISIAIFSTMLRVALREEERSAAYETQRALFIAEAALPHLKQGLSFKTASILAGLLMRELKVAAVAITDINQVLAHVGIGHSLHPAGEPVQSKLLQRAIQEGELQLSDEDEPIQPRHNQLGAAIIVPIREGERVAGAITLYFKRPQEIRTVDIVLAKGLGQLISYQLSIAMNEKMTHLMKEAELKVLQAQIHPHFLFNTLNAIHSLIRVNPDMARHVTMQLGTFMRMNLKTTSSPCIPIIQEMEHLNAYLEIIKIRFEDQFAIDCEMDSDVGEWLIPPATIQLLVENSIKHGLRNKKSGGLIRIALKRLDNRIQIIVEDNGEGIEAEMVGKLGNKPVKSSEGNGIGLYNVNQRLISLFGSDARLRITNKADGGCRIMFFTPCTDAEGSLYGEAN